MTGLVAAAASDSQTAAKTAVVVAAVIINVLVVAAVTALMRRLRARRRAMHQARMVGQLRAAAFDLYPDAVDEEFADITRDLEDGSRS